MALLFDFKCEDGDGCGENALRKTFMQYCSGESSECDANPIPGDWEILENCR